LAQRGQEVTRALARRNIRESLGRKKVHAEAEELLACADVLAAVVCARAPCPCDPDCDDDEEL
jgi:hypothetical protein